jgi:hypothetical protein
MKKKPSVGARQDAALDQFTTNLTQRARRKVDR